MARSRSPSLQEPRGRRRHAARFPPPAPRGGVAPPPPRPGRPPAHRHIPARRGAGVMARKRARSAQPTSAGDSRFAQERSTAGLMTTAPERKTGRRRLDPSGWWAAGADHQRPWSSLPRRSAISSSMQDPRLPVAGRSLAARPPSTGRSWTIRPSSLMIPIPRAARDIGRVLAPDGTRDP